MKTQACILGFIWKGPEKELHVSQYFNPDKDGSVLSGFGSQVKLGQLKKENRLGIPKLQTGKLEKTSWKKIGIGFSSKETIPLN